MTERRALSDPAVQQALGRKRQKYGAKRTEVDGITFASKREAVRYQELCLLVKSGEIGFLRLQPSYDLHVIGIKVARYVGDFLYVEGSNASGTWVLEDVKSKPTRTPIYRLKVKMLQAEYGIQVREI